MQRIGKVFLLPSVTRDGPFAPRHAEEASVESDSSDDEETFKDVPLLDLPPALQTRLMDHQRIGVRWLHSLFLSGSGGILGDDMGLGKTFQVISLLAGLMQERSIERVLILAPVSVLPNWQRELAEHLQAHIRGCTVYLVNSDLTKKKRIQFLDNTFEASVRGFAPKVVLSSYQLVSNMIDEFSNRGRWDYVILDEGHVIKNPSTKTSKAMHELPSRHRLILTGTPVQNNLNEFWAIANWATKGKRFGTLPNFKTDYTIPIVAGQNPKATQEERRIAEIAAKNLLALTKPILLQRKKCELPHNELMQLPEKVELVVWSPLATSQRALYEEFLQSRQFDMAVHRSTCPVEVINHLKTVCRHPLLIEALEANRRRKSQSLQPRTPSLQRSKQLRGQGSQQDFGGDADDDEFDIDALGRGLAGMGVTDTAATDGDGDVEAGLPNLPANATVYDVIGREPDPEELLRGSIKLRILLKLVHRLHFAGHRTLIFSQSRLMLDIIQRVLAHYRFATHRIDGCVKSGERQRIIDEFNDTSDDSGISPSICLLTTKACGFGITLTGADRVIIYDPSWNPAEDRQAVDRAYRIGQTKPVVVYRLIMASSVEEKMYEKQVFKDGVRVVTESGNASRYFSKDETKELFTLGPVDRSAVMERLWKAAGGEMRAFPDTRGDLPSVLGYSRHDTLYTEARPDSQTQGEDAYAQFADPLYAQSDSEDERIGVAPTPCPRRTAGAEQRTQSASTMKPPRKLDPVSAVTGVLGGNKENTSKFLNNASPPPGKGRLSDPFDLMTPPPVPTRAVLSKDGVDPVAYAQLQASKLLSPQMSADGPADGSSPRMGGFEASPLSTGQPSVPTAVSSQPSIGRSDATGKGSDRVKEEAQSPQGLVGRTPVPAAEQWDAAAVADYASLCESKLLGGPLPLSSPSPSPFLSSPVGRLSMPDRVSILTEPSMYGEECEVGEPLDCSVFVQSCEESDDESAGNHTRGDAETPSNDGIRAEPVDPHARLGCGYEIAEGPVDEPKACRRQTLILPENYCDMSGEESPAHELNGAEVVNRCHTPVLPGESMDDASYCNDGIEQSVGSGSASHPTSAERRDQDSCRRRTLVLPEGHRDDISEEDAISNTDGESGMQAATPGDCQEALLRRKTLVLPSDWTDDCGSAPEGLRSNRGSPTKGSVRGVTVLLQAEGWSDLEDEPELDEHSVHVDQLVSEPEHGHCDAEENGSPERPTADEPSFDVSSGAETQSAANASAEVEPEPRRTSLQSTAPMEYGSDFDDESGCYSDFSMPAAGGGAPLGATSRGGFLLNNLCEMGSMKRTASASSAAPRASEAPSSAAGEDPQDQGEHSSRDGADAPSPLTGDQACVTTPVAGRRGQAQDGAQGEGRGATTAGVTVRKRGARLSNYMEPDLFASPAWMVPSLFSPEAARASLGSVPRFSVGSAAGGVDLNGDLAGSAPSVVSEEGGDALGPISAPQAEDSPGQWRAKSVDDEISELIAQVGSLSLASDAAPATPACKISFQTAAGAFSSMIVKAQSVVKAPLAFAALSDSDSDDDGDNDSESGSEDGSDSDQESASDGSGDGSADEVDGGRCAVQDGTPIIMRTNSATEVTTSQVSAAPVDCLGSIDSPDMSVNRSSRMSSGSSGIQSSPRSPCMALFADGDSDPVTEDRSLPSRIASPVSTRATEADSPPSGLSERSLRYFERSLVPELRLPLHKNEFSVQLHALRSHLELPSLTFPVHMPVSALDADACDRYNALVSHARRHEQNGEAKLAARHYCAALLICDEDPLLHGKLTWLHSNIRD